MLFNRLRQHAYRSVSVCSKIIASQRFFTSSKDTVNLAYKIYDSYNTDQPPVVVLHGLLASKSNWASVSEEIHRRTRRKVICVDARNHGESDHSSEHTYPNMVKDVMKLMKTLDLGKVSLLGHSMGGRTAMTLSLNYPDPVSSLIVVDISPVSISGLLSNNFPKLLNYLSSINFSGITTVEEAKALVKEKLRVFGVVQKEIVSFVLKNVGAHPDKTVGWICNMEILKQTFPIMMNFPYYPGKVYPGPTVFIGGGLSDFIPPEDLSGIKGFFPLAQLKYISKVGHNVHEEDPCTFIKLAVDFLKKH